MRTEVEESVCIPSILKSGGLDIPPSLPSPPVSNLCLQLAAFSSLLLHAGNPKFQLIIPRSSPRAANAMSYNDSYGRQGGGYGDDRRNEYGGGDRRDEYSGGRQEGGYGGGGNEYGGGGNEHGERRHGGGEYGDRPSGGYGGGGNEYGERRHGESGGYGGGNEYGGRPSGGYGGGGDEYGNRPSGGYEGGGDEYGERRHEGQHGGQHSSGTSYGGGGYGDSDDFSGAAHHASSHAGNSGDSNLFSSALGMLSGNKSHIQNEDVDEDDAIRQHQNFYGSGGGGQQANSGNMGAAAAMQAMKMFTGGQSGSGKGGQNEFIGMAMGQAAKLFDQQSSQGNTVSS